MTKHIAVIGGNLLGCATTLDLALVEEHDRRVYSTNADKFTVTLFERLPTLGGHALKSISLSPDLHVEVGTYRTLPLMSGTFLSDLVATVNDEVATIAIATRRFAIPGATNVRRGRAQAAHILKPWQSGTYGRIVRSFAAWDWKHDAYHMLHEGWPLLDFMCRVLSNAIWRSVALGAMFWSLNKLNHTNGALSRAMMLAQVVALFAVTLFSPQTVVAMWQRNYTFWASTMPLLWTHGMTAAISRGSSIGFVKHLNDMNVKNAATCAISAGSLMNRSGLEAYLRGSGDDYVRKFKYEREFVRRYMSPIVGCQYAGAKLSEVSSLASHFAMLDSDFANSDVTSRFCTVENGNRKLCTALLDAAKDTMEVDVKLGTAVREILLDEDANKYKVVFGNGEAEIFDGIVLCASPKEGEVVIESSLGSSLSELLGYDRDVVATENHAVQEAEYMAGQGNMEGEDEERPVKAGACSHFAVVVGKARPEFFRFTSEKRIPDLVQITHAPGVSRFERIREVAEDSDGVYTVLCGGEFVSGGMLGEMFEEGAQVKYYEEMSKSVYSHTAVPLDKEVDECFPYMVLGNMFIYAAATDKLAKHPEMDAISAVNAASLFSKAVHWETGNEKEDGDDGDEKGGMEGDEGAEEGVQD